MARMAPRKVVLHGHELSYVDSGSGPAVLFIHGILGSQRQWAHLVDKLDEDHRVLLPDLFGRLPELPYEIVAVPPYAEKSQTAAYYLPPAPDGSRPEGAPAVLATPVTAGEEPKWPVCTADEYLQERLREIKLA